MPLVIGRQSTGQEYIVNLAGLPNLFISYSNDSQLPDIFAVIIKKIHQYGFQIQIALSLSSRIAKQLRPLLPPESLFMKFFHNDYEKEKINSIDEFISALVVEVKQRKTLYRKSNSTLIMPPVMIIFIDNIFEVIMAKKRKTVFAFIELVMQAAPLNMFFILGSSGIYRPLLNQLINVSSSLNNKLKNDFQAQCISQSLGAELIINPDGLLFFRERDEKIYTRLYPG